MKHNTRYLAWSALLAIALAANTARADWNPGDGHKMHFPQEPDAAGFDVNFKFPLQVADDWRCSETGPVSDIHFWFSARNDWLNLAQPLDTQIYSIRVRIHADVPAGTGGVPFSRPGALLWQRDYTVGEVTIREYGTGAQSWYDPATGLVVPNDHTRIYQCNITQIAQPFYQKKGTIFWLHISIDALNELGWKSSDQALYPLPYTNSHFQDDATWRPGPATGWQEIRYPSGPKLGQSMDMAFVITGSKPTFDDKMHFPQTPDPTGADIMFSTPRVVADDWLCSETGPVTKVYFWFSALGDWLVFEQPMDQQIFNIHLSIHADIPAGPGNPYSRPGALLWERDFPLSNHTYVVAKFYTPGQAWYDPAQGFYDPTNHQAMYLCAVDSIPAPFVQQAGTIYWLDISMASEQPLGWKTADVDDYPAPYTGLHFQDDGVFGTFPNPAWQELIWPAVAPRAGQSIDLAFVVFNGVPTGVGDIQPKLLRLEQNFPNPFNPNTTIRYTLAEASNVELAIFGVDGKLVRVLETGEKRSGAFAATWDGRDASGKPVASGVYFYRLKAGSFVETKKMVLMK